MSNFVVVFLVLLLPTVSFAQNLPRLIGATSCGAATCHGGSLDRGPEWNHSLSTWSINDAHAGAAQLLYDDDSRRIVRSLAPDTADSPEEYDNVLRNRCLSCHATVEPADCQSRGLIDETVIAAGVSCESCHGPAEKWVHEHTRVEWSGLSRFDSATGMRDTESIIGRADTCVRCHIGSRTADNLIRDMNHDLIAAGHPALRFDLLLYNESMPMHWRTSSESEQAFNESALRMRKVSRAINLSTAAKLAAERATDHVRDREIPWPELAEYDCFACHQALSGEEFKLPKSQIKRSPLYISDGLPMWNSWHATGQMAKERMLLKTLAPHRSDPKDKAASLPRVAADQRTVAESAMTEKFDPTQSLITGLRMLENDGVLDWHEAAIMYMDIDAALRDSTRDPAVAATVNEQRDQLLEKVEPLLRFNREPANNAELPKRNWKYQSPTLFNAKEFQQAVLSIFK